MCNIVIGRSATRTLMAVQAGIGQAVHDMRSTSGVCRVTKHGLNAWPTSQPTAADHAVTNTQHGNGLCRSFGGSCQFDFQYGNRDIPPNGPGGGRNIKSQYSWVQSMISKR